MVIAQCANCGKEIKTYPSRVKRNKKRESNFYCSQQCKSEYWSKHRTGENNPKSKPKITVKCAWCDADILLPSWRVKKSNRHFCSVQCKGSWQSEHNKGPLSPYYKKESHIALNCGYCGKKFETSISQYKRYKNNYCSRKCADKAKIGVELPGNRAELHKCICPICGKEFYQSKNTKNPKKTCSQKCGYVLRGQTRDKKVTLICQYCGKEYRAHIATFEELLDIDEKTNGVYLLDKGFYLNFLKLQGEKDHKQRDARVKKLLDLLQMIFPDAPVDAIKKLNRKEMAKAIDYFLVS